MIECLIFLISNKRILFLLVICLIANKYKNSNRLARKISYKYLVSSCCNKGIFSKKMMILMWIISGQIHKLIHFKSIRILSKILSDTKIKIQVWCKVILMQKINSKVKIVSIKMELITMMMTLKMIMIKIVILIRSNNNRVDQ